MAEYLTTDTDLQKVANAIRTKGGTSTILVYPNGFTTAIAAIASDCTATAGDIRNGKTAWVGNAKVTGNMSEKSAETYNTSTSDRTISGGRYLSGTQTIKAVTTSNIDAGNIKKGVTITVGDANSSTRIKNVTGTFTSDGTATAGDILSGKIGYVNGNKITGSISSQAATTYNVSTSDQTIAAGKYLSGAQTIRKVTTANISAGNIKKGVTIQVGDSGSATRIANVTGTCPQCSLPSSDVFPILWNRGVSWLGWGWGKDSSGTAAQTTNGYYCWDTLTTSSNRAFCVPSRMTWTYFTSSAASGTSTKTFEPNTWYWLRGHDAGGSNNLSIYTDANGVSKLTDFFKLVSWAYA